MKPRQTFLSSANASGKGERITITKHGVPVAVLHPPDKTYAIDIETVIAKLRAFREGQNLGGLSLREMMPLI